MAKTVSDYMDYRPKLACYIYDKDNNCIYLTKRTKNDVPEDILNLQIDYVELAEGTVYINGTNCKAVIIHTK